MKVMEDSLTDVEYQVKLRKTAVRKETQQLASAENEIIELTRKISPDSSTINGNNTGRENIAEARKTPSIRSISDVNGWITKELMETDGKPLS